MNEDTFTKLQYQVRENSEELNDFLKDLKHWENDMKKKDKELSNPISDSVKLPPVRNQASRRRKKKKKNVIEKDNGTKPKVKRIPGNDYSSWDKFDADGALKELDDNCKNTSQSSDDSDTEEEELEIERRKQKAILEKDKGNDFFKEGKYDEAIACYTSGMNSYASNALLPANRAMAFLKKGNLACAEKDCDLALSLDPTYVKAYLRRGAARFGLRNFELARSDFEKALEFDPSNKQAKVELSKIEKELQKNIVEHNEENGKGNDGHDFQSSFVPGPKGDSVELDKRGSKQNGIVMAINKPPHRRSKKPLKRIEIKEVVSDSEDNEWETECSANFVNCNNQIVISPVQEESVRKETSSDSSTNTKQKSLITDSSFLNEKPLVPPVPQSAYQFYADWRALRKYPASQFQYLKQLQPEQIPKLFKQSMDAEVFSDILRILKDYFLQDERNLYQYLKHLSQIGRFGTLALFLSQEEQKSISTMLDIIKSSEEYTKEEIHSLQQSFGIDIP